MALCSPCGDVILPVSFEECEILTKDCEIERMYSALCNYEFADLSQETFDAALAAGAISVMPSGNITYTAATAGQVKISCKTTNPGATTYTFTYVSYSQSEGIEMYQYWRDLYNAKSQITLFWKACDGKWFINQPWADWANDGESSGSVPSDYPIGYPASFTAVPILVRDETNELCTWTLTFEIKFNNVFVPTEIPGLVF